MVSQMNNSELKRDWLKKYSIVPDVLKSMSDINTAATAFNTNIDAVLKISGKGISKLINESGLSLAMLEHIRETRLNAPEDVIKGIFKCFTKGIAEEWLTEDKTVFDWMVANLGYDRLQMGGQGGIVANVLAVTGVKKVYAHTNSLPKLQAEQFLMLDNLVSFDSEGKEASAYKIDRKEDIPLIHWIIEFDKGDCVEVDGQKFVCPKANRFIATYDPLNLRLVKDEAFIKATTGQAMDYVILSGYHALTEKNEGLRLQRETLPIIQSWRKNGAVVHLEVASTQDIAVRKAVIGTIAPEVDSIGVNERETIDILEALGKEDLAKACEKNTHSVNLFKAILEIKKHIKCGRVQMHMFGLYITLQDKGFKISPEANLRGMMMAATLAAGKAGTGSLNDRNTLLWAQGQEVSDIGLEELRTLADYVGNEALLKTGLGEYDGFDVIAVPTILIEKPVTLVGMGDTISSLSLLGAR